MFFHCYVSLPEGTQLCGYVGIISETLKRILIKQPSIMESRSFFFFAWLKCGSFLERI